MFVWRSCRGEEAVEVGVRGRKWSVVWSGRLTPLLCKATSLHTCGFHPLTLRLASARNFPCFTSHSAEMKMPHMTTILPGFLLSSSQHVGLESAIVIGNTLLLETYIWNV